ncbi:MAG: DNA translocase FtsK 4TM domain-containing protein [Chitinophagaceae bacterium]|nr:DNA translocase FtsK 4TM domain-containing protein [Chitinophagaceae bacterium]
MSKKTTSQSKKTSITNSKKSSKTTTKPKFTLATDGRLRKIVGLFLLLFSVFLAFALISYLFTWQEDQDKVINNRNFVDFILHSKGQIQNTAGSLGAYLSHQLIFKGFGISSLLFVLFFGMWGINLLLPQRISSTLKSFFYTSFFILFLSPVFSYFFRKDIFAFPFGGALGNEIIAFFNKAAGEMGTLFLMIGCCLMLIIIFFNPIFHLAFWDRFKSQSENDSEIEPIIESIPADTSTNNIQPESAHIPTETAIQEPEAIFNTDHPIVVPDSFWELEETTEVDIPENKSTIVLDPEEITSTSQLFTETNELPLEVVQHEENIIHVENEHISIESHEPYDPSLELRNYKFPTIDLLELRNVEEIAINKTELEQNKNQIIHTLKSFGIQIAKITATVGPTVTLYEIVPAEGVRISKIRNLEDDIALSLSALGIRIIAPIPGKGTIGIEVPNINKQIVSMRTLISSDKFIKNDYSLPIALGKKIDNENYIVDLATMPHLLMAGATGQGKSVGINTILVSLLYKKHPSQLKFVLVDPKKVELSIYKMIEKHFLAKLPNEEEAIITDTKKVIHTLNALCIEMDNRYDLLKEAGVRNIKEYNEKFIKRRLNPNKGHQYLPFIVLVVDEFADLIMTAGKEVEMPIARLAQLARAVGIHLIIATQRPSVNVITGTIKANFPGRIAFRVSAKVDSRTILDTGGADQLVGRGDMLILNGNDLVRVQCAFVDTPEVERIVEFIGKQQGYPTAFDLPEYEGPESLELAGQQAKSLKDVDQMFEQCARLVVSSGSGSTSMLQRRFNLGYNRAGRIMDQLEAAGIVGASTGGKPRELMVHNEIELEEILRSILNK